MARVKLSEYRAKHLFVDGYQGWSIRYGEAIPQLPENTFVLKVDQGVKKRGKQGLVAVGVKRDELAGYIEQWHERGFDQFLLEPMLPHVESEERYFAVERTRSGMQISYSQAGGVEVESHAAQMKHYDVEELERLAQETGLPADFVLRILATCDQEHISFVEFNPLIVREGVVLPLDAAVLVDSAGAYFAQGWSEGDIVEQRKTSESEKRVRELDAKSPAALKLHVLDPDAALWLLLSGGGASIVIADTVQAAGYGEQLGNYGEYSGGPTTDETYLYTKEILTLLIASKAPKKALIIAGGVANFTDVAQTFRGIIKALSEVAEVLHAQSVKVFVRRGGPHEQEGLQQMQEFLESNGLLGAVYGSSIVLTRAATDAITYIQEGVA